MQPRLVLVFRGKGMRISAAEKAAYDPRVVVLWQQKAWVDRRVLGEITDALIEDEIKHYGNDEGKLDEEGIWLGDNLDCQVCAPSAPPAASLLHPHTRFGADSP